jgi:phosphoribosylpyrophosphate synthetase
MLHNTGLAVSRYYRREENMVRYDCTEIFASMDIHRSNIIASGSKKLCKFRNLKYSEDEVKACIGASIDLLNKAGINLIIPVASGGFEPALLVADYLGVSNLFPIRYSIAHRFDKEVRIPRNIPLPMASQTINGKNVLIVDDISDTGNTAKRIAKWVTSLGPKRAFYLCVDAFVPAELENFGFEPIKRCGKGYLHSTET